MTVSVEDGTVVCSLEDKDTVFLSISHGCFNGFFNGKLKISVSAGQAERAVAVGTQTAGRSRKTQAALATVMRKGLRLLPL